MRLDNFFLVIPLSITIAACAAHADQPLTRQFTVSESLRLVYEQRYADGVVMSQKMKILYPSDPICLETQGTVALQVGALSLAASDFRSADQIAPNDPIALYGESLVHMLHGQDMSALDLLNKIDTTNLTDSSANEIAEAKAICLAQTGQADAAVSMLKSSTDPTALEISALVSYRQSNYDGSILKAFLEQSMINGVPQVVEEPGLRLLLPLSDSGPSIEPSITDKDTQQSLGRRFDTASWSDATGTVSGQVRIEPPKTVPAGIGMVTLSVDDTVVGSTNTPPFQVSWDTTAFSNGVHDLTFTLADAEGTGTTIQDENLNVLNSGSNGDESALLPPGLIARLWNAMKIGPDYKVAEYELALSLEKSHDESGYETHILRAAALDPDYRDVRDRIHPLFIGQVPSAFPVPPGMSLPRSLGLSAGSASAAGFWAGSPNVREIALTFDDGPLPIPTAQLLNALQTANAHGTFFVVGMRAQESPNSLRQMAANGNAVEDHTFTHPNLTQILPQHILQEILRTAVVIQATTGLWPHFLRPPGGNTNTLVLETAKACGMSGAFWTIDALPAEESGSSSEVVNWVVSRARPGAIVLMHNGMSATVGAIPQLVQELRERGYKMVTIRQLAADSLAGRKQGT